MGGLVLYEEAKTFSSLHQNSKLLETMNSKQKSRLNLVKIQRVCPRGVRADPGIHQSASLRAMDEAGVSHGVKQREAAPQSVEDSNVDSNELWATVNACACWWGMP